MSFFKLIANFKGSTSGCAELINDNTELPNWTNAFDHCKNYRDYLSSLDIDNAFKVKSYLLKKEDIDVLLSQNDGDMDGIRIYIGRENFEADQFAIRLFAVACKKNEEELYEDWAIPKRAEVNFATTRIGELRPCPDECSGNNDLSEGP